MVRLSEHPYILTLYHADVTADGHGYMILEYAQAGAKGTAPKPYAASPPNYCRNNLPLTREVVCSAGGRDSRRSRKRINETSYTPGSVMPYANARHGWPSIST